MEQIIVTTGDIAQPYDILGPVYFQVSNKGLISNHLSSLKQSYSAEIQRMKASGRMSADRADWGFLYGEWSVGQNDFEAAFFIATEELKKRAKMVGADAIIGMRQDIDMDTNGFAYFYLQMYGTAVKFKSNSMSFAEQYEYAEKMMDEGNYAEAEMAYFQLGGFRDSKDKAEAAYAALRADKYRRAEEMLAEKKYQEAEKLFAGLKNYKDSKEKAEAARLAHEEWRSSLIASAQKSAEERQSNNKNWICPGCGRENVYFISKCSCGVTR